MAFGLFEKQNLFSTMNKIDTKLDSVLATCSLFEAMFGDTLTAKAAADILWEEVFAPFYRYGYGDCTLDDALKSPEAKIAVEELAKIFKKEMALILDKGNKE